MINGFCFGWLMVFAVQGSTNKTQSLGLRKMQNCADISNCVNKINMCTMKLKHVLLSMKQN